MMSLLWGKTLGTILIFWVLGLMLSTGTSGGELSDETSMQNVPQQQEDLDYMIYLPIVLKAPKSNPNSRYNRPAAVAYAETWVHDRNEDFPEYGVSCGCNDCTNYASQVLFNGGYPFKNDHWNPETVYEWWYRKGLLGGYENSKTWSATDWFNTFVHQFQEHEFELGTNVDKMLPKMEPGDFIVLDTRNNESGDMRPDGIPDHIRVVVGYGSTSTDPVDYGCQTDTTPPPSTYTLLINQHCTDRQHVKWDYNLKPSDGLWFVHVKW